MKKIILFSFVTFSVVFSQIVNIENKRLSSDTTGWDGTIEAGFDVNQNNALFMSASAKAQVQHKWKKDIILGVANWRFTNGGTSRFVNDGMVHLRYNHKFNKWFRWEVFSQVQYNELLNLRLRVLGGTGPRFKLLNKNWMSLYASSLYMFEYENLAVDDTLEFNHRMSSYISWTIDPNSNFSFIATTYFQPKLTDWSDFRISANYTLRFRAFKRLAFKIEFSFLYDTRPPSTIRDFVFQGNTGVVFNLRK